MVETEDTVDRAARRLRRGRPAGCDALVLDSHLSDACRCALLRDLDPSLAAFVFAWNYRESGRVHLLFSCFGELPIIERPVARFEVLDMTAAAVQATRENRGASSPAEPFEARALEGGLPASPRPDTWSSATLRRRVAHLGRVVGLTDREQQAIRGMVRRLSNEEMGIQLGVTPHAVKKFVRAALAKLKLVSRHEVPWLLEKIRV